MTGTSSRFVCGGGWIKGPERTGRPRSQFLTLLSLAWTGFSVPALAYMLVLGEFWPGILLPPHPILIVLALCYRFSEKPVTWTQLLPNPDHDPRNLY